MRHSWTDKPRSTRLRARVVLTVGAILALTVVGTASSASGGGGLSAQPLDFGTVALGSSKTMDLTVTNVGTQTLAQGSIGVTFKGGPDINAWSALFGSTCPGAGGLAPGQSCSLPVTFAPAKKGGHKTHLLLSDDLGDSLSLSATGTGG